MTEAELVLRMGAYAIVPDLEPNQQKCLARLERERHLIAAGENSEFFASGTPAGDALIMIDELIGFTQNYLFRERSNSAS